MEDIARLRKKLGIKQLEMSLATGESNTQISIIERGYVGGGAKEYKINASKYLYEKINFEIQKFKNKINEYEEDLKLLKTKIEEAENND